MYSVIVPALNLRSCASTDCKILGKLTKGEIVDTIKENGSWFKVKTQKGTGFVIKKSLKKVLKKENSIPYGKIIIFIFLLCLFCDWVDKKNRTKNTNIKQNSEPAEESENEAKIARNAFKLLSNRSKEVFGDLWAKREKKANRITAYDVLEIAPTNSQEEIKKAYKEVVKKYHPDHNPNKDADAKFRKIKKAYDLLNDENKKAEYDLTLVNRAKTILLVAFSVQQLRHIIAEDYRIDPKKIKFTQTDDVFINDEFAGCWCEMMGFFVYYKPQTAKNIKFDPVIHEIIYLTSYDEYELKESIAINFGCETEAIELEYTGESSEYAGVVLKFGEYALCWRETDSKFYEFYCPTIPDEPKEAHADDIPEEYDFSDDEDATEEKVSSNKLLR